MTIAMLRGLLCCFGDKKKDEPGVAYTKQDDDRYRRFFKCTAPTLVPFAGDKIQFFGPHFLNFRQSE